MDIRTIFLLCSLTSVVTVIALLLYKRSFPRTAPTLYVYAAAEVMLFLSFLLFASREALPGRVYVGTANALFIFGLSFEAYALSFAVRGFNLKAFSVVCAAASVLVSVFMITLPGSPNTWVVSMSFLLSLLFACGGIFLVGAKEMNVMQRYSGMFILFLAALMAARGIDAIWKRDSFVLLTTDFVQVASYLLVFLVSCLLPILYLLILKEKDIEDIAASEERFRALFEHAASGIAVGEMPEEGAREKGDYIIREANPAFLWHTGLDAARVAGRSVREMYPEISRAPFFDRFESVVRSGEAVSFEEYSEVLGRHFFVNAYRVGEGRFAAVFQDITRRKQAEESLQKAFEEKHSLLQELQHRVKNSFAMIISLISLTSQASASPEVRAALEAVISRIRAIAELYTLLYVTNSYSRVPLDEYCERIARAAIGVSAHVALRADFDSVSFPMKDATAAGMILTELITNALKHGFPGGRSGMIEVSLKRGESTVRLEVADDGTGFSGDAPPHEGLGLTLVRSLAEQLDGAFTIRGGEKTRCAVEFPLHTQSSQEL